MLSGPAGMCVCNLSAVLELELLLPLFDFILQISSLKKTSGEGAIPSTKKIGAKNSVTFSADFSHLCHLMVHLPGMVSCFQYI